MNASQIFEDLETGCVVEIESAATSYYSETRGLNVRQRFYIYPNDDVYLVNMADGKNEVIKVVGEPLDILAHRNPTYFQRTNQL